MRYLGSKASTVGALHGLVASRVGSGSFCDPFGGIGVVGSHFKNAGYEVWSGDILTFAHYFQVARIQLNRPLRFTRLREALGLDSPSEIPSLLNGRAGKTGWFCREYAGKRRYFTSENAAQIEHCRRTIGRWTRNGWLTRNERAVLLASLIDAMDKVANTAGTYYAHLKQWYRKALRPFRFEFLQATCGKRRCRAVLCEARELLARRSYDIVYLDPPYNERCYASYYHLPETMARQMTPRVQGASGIPRNVTRRSRFNMPQEASNALKQLLKVMSCRLLVFHYSDDGLIPPDQVRTILAGCGETEEFVLDATGYTTERKPRDSEHRVYLVSHD